MLQANVLNTTHHGLAIHRNTVYYGTEEGHYEPAVWGGENSPISPTPPFACIMLRIKQKPFASRAERETRHPCSANSLLGGSPELWLLCDVKAYGNSREANERPHCHQ